MREEGERKITPRRKQDGSVDKRQSPELILAYSHGKLYCRKCHHEKDPSEFYLSNHQSTGRQSCCISCSKTERQRIRQNGYGRRRHLKVRYGLSESEYEEMLEEQGGVCAICGKPPSQSRHLDVDHNHETGEVRGLLCTKCNSEVGVVENSTRLHRLLRYLKRGR